ncbi:hypothetical protein COOONC_17431 [Cooperia oncophora]
MTSEATFQENKMKTIHWAIYITDMESVDKVVKFGEVMVGGVCQEENEEAGCTMKDIGTVMKVKRAYYSDYYQERCTDTKDIAFLELENDIPEHINHICLPHLHNVDEMDIESSKLIAAGWGSNPRKKLVSSPRLQKIELGKRISDAECAYNVPEKQMDTFCTLDFPDKNVCVVSF